jgi:hypothetical protein
MIKEKKGVGGRGKEEEDRVKMTKGGGKRSVRRKK